MTFKAGDRVRYTGRAVHFTYERIGCTGVIAAAQNGISDGHIYVDWDDDDLSGKYPFIANLELIESTPEPYESWFV